MTKTAMGDPTDPKGVTPAVNLIRHNFIINPDSSGLGTTGGLWNLVRLGMLLSVTVLYVCV